MLHNSSLTRRAESKKTRNRDGRTRIGDKTASRSWGKPSRGLKDQGRGSCGKRGDEEGGYPDEDRFLIWTEEKDQRLVVILLRFRSCGEYDENALHVLVNSTDIRSITENGITNDQEFADQPDAPWGISRVSVDDQTQADNLKVTDLSYDYFYNLPPVDVYIVGVRISHKEFGGRAEWGVNLDSDDTITLGHGTHVAGIAGGVKYGIAKDTHIIAVKSSDSHDIRIQGLEWVFHQVQSTGRPSVANLSWGWPVPKGEEDPEDNPCDVAVNAMINAGIHVVIAAGNRNWDVSKTTPARVPGAITVASVDIDGNRATSSNYGTGIDIFAPGVKITSAWIGSDEDSKVLSGTSMVTTFAAISRAKCAYYVDQAAPHVTGLVAYLTKLYGNRTPADMKTLLQELALKEVLHDTDDHPLNGSPNLLARNDFSNSQVGVLSYIPPQPKSEIENNHTAIIDVEKSTSIALYGTALTDKAQYVSVLLLDSDGHWLATNDGQIHPALAGKNGPLQILPNGRTVVSWGPFANVTRLVIYFGLTLGLDLGHGLGRPPHGGSIIANQVQEYDGFDTAVSMIPYCDGRTPGKVATDVIVHVVRKAYVYGQMQQFTSNGSSPPPVPPMPPIQQT
ncbi:subtilisin-like protein [Sistotremastrum niveocremeum HHB9708]|uniref:Subtilisin-like protein n=1 Tax=Sistotremastrum niveocremeum HHB9708 TaxID=1314777 RepID=A0A164PCJ9_9AGAM|nr:subtilisin-like protein [Sistotremastrum niveocremeum HHB9708]